MVWTQNVATNNSNAPEIVFENPVYDYGTIPYKGDGSHSYVFTNKGTAPLVIENCVKGCGCTAVSWTHTPVAPGGTGIVTATYNTRNVGYFSKGVDVYSNAKTSKVHLRLKGTVAEPVDNGTSATSGDGPTIVFTAKEYDFKTIRQGSPAVCEFTFTNTGKTNLQVINCIKDKGIIAVDKNRQTVLPGQQGKIVVTCNTQIAGDLHTRVILYTNAGDPVVVHIKGKIVVAHN